jgi:hypothetical protein
MGMKRSNAQKFVKFNSHNYKLSNDAPHAYYSASKNKIRILGALLRAIRGQYIRGQYRPIRAIEDQKGSNTQKLVKFKSPNDKLSNDTPHDYGTLKYKIPVFKGYKGSIRGQYHHFRGFKVQNNVFIKIKQIKRKLKNSSCHSNSNNHVISI